MNQTNEAAQGAAAIADDTDERAAFMAWYRANAPRNATLGAWDAWRAGRNALRAALKAQPAPTESTQAEIAKLRQALKEAREWTGHPDNIAIIDAALGVPASPWSAAQGALPANPNLTTSGVTCQPEAAQGEDSARMEAQVTAAARVLANRSADQCGVNRDDNWKVYGQDFIDDARAALEAARAAPQPQEKP